MPKAKAAFAATALLAAHAIVRAADLSFTRGELINPWEIHRELRVAASAAPAVQEFFLSFSQYQDLVLFHPTLGYYSSGRVSFTQDYRTFPDALSPYFGQMVAQHIFDMWAGMRKAGTLSANEVFTIAEFGAGDGELAESILNYVNRRASAVEPIEESTASQWQEFAKQTVYACYDRSPALSAAQSKRNARFGARFEAREGDATDPTATIPAGSLKGIVLSNELPDAFSVHKVVLSPSGSAEVAFVAPTLSRASWSKLEKDLPAALQEGLKNEDRAIQTKFFGRKRETTVYLSRDGFVSVLEAMTSAGDYKTKLKAMEFREIYIPIEAVPELADHVRRYIPAYAYQLARGDKGFAAYINLGEGHFIQGAGRVLKAGYVITIDYGANWDGVSPIEFDHLRTYGPGTRRERPDPYHSPTLNDITTDVNFSHVVEEGRLAGLRPVFYGSQHTLLSGTPIHLEVPPPERGNLTKGDLEDYQAWVQSFYTWDVFKILVQQKESTDAAYTYPDPRAEPLTVELNKLTVAQQAAEKQIELRLRERLAISQP
ncbi:MAG TPA: SAM-dependent methyltransferase [Bryobacteraceae bacterium]|jgi:SAM-dependent MidA family methyltransferase